MLPKQRENNDMEKKRIGICVELLSRGRKNTSIFSSSYLTLPRLGTWMLGWVMTNSPIWGSSVKPLTPSPMVNTRMVEDEYMQYPAAWTDEWRVFWGVGRESGI